MSLNQIIKSLSIILFAFIFLSDKAILLSPEECFCGNISVGSSQEDEELFDYNRTSYSTGKILNIIDQSVSKYNSLHIQSEKAKLPFKLVGDKENLSKLMDVRLTFLKSILFETNNKTNNNVLNTSFMMGGIVNFDINIEIENYYNTNETTFNLLLVQNEYQRGKTINKNKNKYKLNQKLKYDNDGSLEVKVCEFMYNALLHLTNNEFNVSIESDMIAYPKNLKKKKGAKKEQPKCNKEIIFKKRYENEYLTGIVYNETMANFKNHYRKHRFNLIQNKKSQYYKVAVNDSNSNAPSIFINKKSVDKVDDRSSTSRVVEDSEIVSEKSLSSKEEVVYNLRNRDVVKKVDENVKDKDDEENNKNRIKELENDIKKKMNNKIREYFTNKNKIDNIVKENYYELRSRNVPKRLEAIQEEKDKENKKELNDNIAKIESESNSIDSETLSESNSTLVKENKKRRKVIVLLETVECSKCINDIDSIKFLNLLNVKSRLI